MSSVSYASIDVRRDLITATAAVSGLSTVIFGLFTNLPVAIA
jgi:AGZA family xanthine/uracil permease-like MFS transporter